MPSHQELLQNIRPGMRLDKDFFLKIYGYEISTPGFAEIALEKLAEIYLLYATPGQANPRNTYAAIVAEYEYAHGKEMQEVAQWYLKQLHDRQKSEQKRGDESRKQEMTAELRQMSNSDLIALCASLTGVN